VATAKPVRRADLDTNLDSVIELLTETNELELLADFVRESGDGASKA
jgi:hypothetical protein